MNTCETCKWWACPSAGIEMPVTPGILSWGKSLDGMTTCENPKLDELPVHGIVTKDDSPATGFITGPKFGCIHWECK